MHRNRSNESSPVRTAVLLAAGMGSRLSPITDSTPKCLVKVSQVTILERLMRSLRAHGFKRLHVITGHLSEVIEDYLGSHYSNIEITYTHSPVYQTTNNIYSLWLAGKVIDEPFLLIESDLVFKTQQLAPMLQPDRVAISKMLPWMNGTTVTLNRKKQVEAFCLGAKIGSGSPHFKSVNINSFSRKTWRSIWERLDYYISAGKVNGYYEAVFAELVAEGAISFAPVFFDPARWYEIDSHEDLSAAEKMFPKGSSVPIVKGKQGIPTRKLASIPGETVPPSIPLITPE